MFEWYTSDSLDISPTVEQEAKSDSSIWIKRLERHTMYVCMDARGKKEGRKAKSHRLGTQAGTVQTLTSAGGPPTAFQLTKSCSFSIKTNVKIVCGLRIGKGLSTKDSSLSVKSVFHSRQAQPSRRPAFHEEQGAFLAQALGCYLEEALLIPMSAASVHHDEYGDRVEKGEEGWERTDEPPALLAACTRLLSTSAGAQMVVATVPATRLDSMWVLTSSCRAVLARRERFAAVYLYGRDKWYLLGRDPGQRLWALICDKSPSTTTNTATTTTTTATVPVQYRTGQERIEGDKTEEKEKAYGAICPTFIRTDRTTVGPSPRANVPKPSSRAIRHSPRTASG